MPRKVCPILEPFEKSIEVAQAIELSTLRWHSFYDKAFASSPVCTNSSRPAHEAFEALMTQDQDFLEHYLHDIEQTLLKDAIHDRQYHNDLIYYALESIVYIACFVNGLAFLIGVFDHWYYIRIVPMVTRNSLS